MCSGKFDIRHETEGDSPILSQLAAEAFGPGRFARSAYRVREGIPPVAGLSLCGMLDRRLVGGIRFTMPYYGRFGFTPVPPGQVTLPGPVDPARLLGFELVPGAMEDAAGAIKGYAR